MRLGDGNRVDHLDGHLDRVYTIDNLLLACADFALELHFAHALVGPAFFGNCAHVYMYRFQVPESLWARAGKQLMTSDIHSK